jgi:hypothetical protein
MAASSTSYVLSILGLLLLNSLLGLGLFCYAIDCLVGPTMGPAAVILFFVVFAVAINHAQKEKAGGSKVKLD